jgi:hypothetical protein
MQIEFIIFCSESRGRAGLRAAGRQDQAEDQRGEHADQGHKILTLHIVLYNVCSLKPG